MDDFEDAVDVVGLVVSVEERASTRSMTVRTYSHEKRRKLVSSPFELVGSSGESFQHHASRQSA